MIKEEESSIEFSNLVNVGSGPVDLEGRHGSSAFSLVALVHLSLIGSNLSGARALPVKNPPGREYISNIRRPFDSNISTVSIPPSDRSFRSLE